MSSSIFYHAPFQFRADSPLSETQVCDLPSSIIPHSSSNPPVILVQEDQVDVAVSDPCQKNP